MSTHSSKLIDTPPHHLWTDTLHARALARQTANRWNRDTYVRWTVTTAWTAFEMACKEAVQASRLGNDFKRNLDKAIAVLSLPKLDWSRGIWQQVSKVYQLRKEYMHVGVSEKHVFREVAEADFTVATLRDAIKSIYNHATKLAPAWVEDDEDKGWDSGHSSVGHITLTHAGADEHNPNTIKVAYVFRGSEYITELLPPGTDTSSIIENLIKAVRVPISATRVYKGNELIEERELRIRGS